MDLVLLPSPPSAPPAPPQAAAAAGMVVISRVQALVLRACIRHEQGEKRVTLRPRRHKKHGRIAVGGPAAVHDDLPSAGACAGVAA